MTAPYCAVQDVRDRGVAAEAATDAQVTKALDRSTRTIDTYTGRDFRARNRVVRLDGSGTRTLFLDDRPVISVTNILVNGLRLDSANYVLYPDAGFIKLDGSGRSIFAGFSGAFPIGSQNVEVQALFGFAEIPPEVKEACLKLTLEFLRNQPAEADVTSGSGLNTRKAIGVRRIRIDDLSVDFAYPASVKNGGRRLTTGLPEVDAVLDRFRKDLDALVV